MSEKCLTHRKQYKPLTIFIILSTTQHFAAQATASLQTAKPTLSSLTSLRLWSLWLVGKLHFFF